MFSKFQSVSDAIRNPLKKIQNGIKQLNLPNILQRVQFKITPIIQGKLYHIDYPTAKTIQLLQKQLQTAHQYQLWNIGQYPYSQELLAKILGEGGRNSDGRQLVYNLTYQFFANIPFCEMIKSIHQIQCFLNMNENNKVFLHCQQNKRRSAIFLSSYVFLTGKQPDIVHSILTINKLLELQMEQSNFSSNESMKQGHGERKKSSIYKSQHLVLKNLMNYINKAEFINKSTWEVKKIIISNPPRLQHVIKFSQQLLQLTQQQRRQKFVNNMKIMLQIRSAQGILFKKIFAQSQFSHQNNTICLKLKQQQQPLLRDDFLLMVKYVYEKRGYSILRTQLNTNFIYDSFLRIHRQDMDLSVKNAHIQNDDIFLDLFLEENRIYESELSQLELIKSGEMGRDSQGQEGEQVGTGQMKQKKGSGKDNKNTKSPLNEQEGFNILDQDEEVEHNQKLQQEVEQELARELENLRKNKSQKLNKSQQAIKAKQSKSNKGQSKINDNLINLSSEGQQDGSSQEDSGSQGQQQQNSRTVRQNEQKLQDSTQSKKDNQSQQNSKSISQCENIQRTKSSKSFNTFSKSSETSNFEQLKQQNPTKSQNIDNLTKQNQTVQQANNQIVQPSKEIKSKVYQQKIESVTNQQFKQKQESSQQQQQQEGESQESSQEQSQEQEQEEDLQDYLSKLQQKAQKN